MAATKSSVDTWVIKGRLKVNGIFGHLGYGEG